MTNDTHHDQSIAAPPCAHDKGFTGGPTGWRCCVCLVDMRTAKTDTAPTDFLLARIAEDEAVARSAAIFGGGWHVERDGSVVDVVTDGPHGGASVVDDARAHADSFTPHIALHDPARALAECEAKRRIVERHSADGPDWYHGDETTCSAHGDDMEPWPCDDLRDLAAVYADHPDYRKEWKP